MDKLRKVVFFTILMIICSFSLATQTTKADPGVLITTDGTWFTIQNDYFKILIHKNRGYPQEAYFKRANGSWSNDICHAKPPTGYGYHVPEWGNAVNWFVPGIWVTNGTLQVTYNTTDVVICRFVWTRGLDPGANVNFTYVFYADKPYYYVAIDREYLDLSIISNTQMFWTISPDWVNESYAYDYTTGFLTEIDTGTFYMQETLSQNDTDCLPFFASHSIWDNGTFGVIILGYSDPFEKTSSYNLAENSAYPDDETEWQINYWDANDYAEIIPNLGEIQRTEILQYIYEGNITTVFEDSKALKSARFADDVPDEIYSISVHRHQKTGWYGILAWSPFVNLGRMPHRIRGYTSLEGQDNTLLIWNSYAKNSSWSSNLSPYSEPDNLGETETVNYADCYTNWIIPELSWWENVTQYRDSDKMIFNATAKLSQNTTLTHIYTQFVGQSKLDDLVQISPTLYDARRLDSLFGWVGLVLNITEGTCELDGTTLYVYALNGTEQEYIENSTWSIEIVFWSHMGNVTNINQVTGLHERDQLQFNDAWLNPLTVKDYFGFEDYIIGNIEGLILAGMETHNSTSTFPVFMFSNETYSFYSTLDVYKVKVNGTEVNFDFNFSTAMLSLNLTEGYNLVGLYYRDPSEPRVIYPTNFMVVDQDWLEPERKLNVTLTAPDIDEADSFYCGDYGRPSEIHGGRLLFYNSTSKEATIRVSAITVILIFRVTRPTSDVFIWATVSIGVGSGIYLLYRRWRR